MNTQCKCSDDSGSCDYCMNGHYAEKTLFPRLMTDAEYEEMIADPDYCELCEEINCGQCHCCQCSEGNGESDLNTDR